MSLVDAKGLAITLPANPQGLPPEWQRDYSHRYPNGERYVNSETGEKLDFHPGQPGAPGFGGQDHWHLNGGKWHYLPGSECPTSDKPDNEESSGNSAAKAAGVGAALYWIISEGSRILFPPRNLLPVP